MDGIKTNHRVIRSPCLRDKEESGGYVSYVVLRKLNEVYLRKHWEFRCNDFHVSAIKNLKCQNIGYQQTISKDQKELQTKYEEMPHLIQGR